jgi:hypothetical protein
VTEVIVKGTADQTGPSKVVVFAEGKEMADMI